PPSASCVLWLPASLPSFPTRRSSDLAVSITGAVLATVASSEVSGEPSTEPSLGVTTTRSLSPLAPLPAVERSSVEEVSPVRLAQDRQSTGLYCSHSQ